MLYCYCLVTIVCCCMKDLICVMRLSNCNITNQLQLALLDNTDMCNSGAALEH